MLDVQSPPGQEPEKIAPSELLMVGMMLYLEQGLVLEWLHGDKECRHSHEDKEEISEDDPHDGEPR